MPESEDILGFLKYEGTSVSDGFIDARTAARALEGFDETLRYLVSVEAPVLAGIDFEIPVLIKKGSWEAAIPQTIGQWIWGGLGLATTTYAITAAKKMAENDFKDVGIRKAFHKALEALQWLIRIGKHLHSFTHRKLTATKWKNNNTEIGIKNEAGEYLFVPVAFFSIYSKCPAQLLSKISSVIEADRSMSIGLKEKEHIVEEKVSIADKFIFYVDIDEDTNAVLFPELQHGMQVELDGLVTRENGITNSIGFRYNEHILQCHPRDGSVIRYKEQLFEPCRISGEITRESDDGTFTEKRPKIIFHNLQILEGPQPRLFNEE